MMTTVLIQLVSTIVHDETPIVRYNRQRNFEHLWIPESGALTTCSKKVIRCDAYYLNSFSLFRFNDAYIQ